MCFKPSGAASQGAFQVISWLTMTGKASWKLWALRCVFLPNKISLKTFKLLFQHERVKWKCRKILTVKPAHAPFELYDDSEWHVHKQQVVLPSLRELNISSVFILRCLGCCHCDTLPVTVVWLKQPCSPHSHFMARGSKFYGYRKYLPWWSGRL